jgi:cobalt/nickel transport system permease protein
VNPFPIDAFAYGNRLRPVAASEKMLLAAGFVSLAITFKSPALSAAIVVLTAVILRQFAGIGVRDFWGFLWLPAGFIMVGVVPMAVEVVGPTTPGVLGAVAVGPWTLGVTSRALTQASAILASSFGSVAGTLYLALTTPMVDLTDQLRRWRVPSLLVEMMMLVYRFVFVLLETAAAMHVAQEVRLGYSSRGRWMRSMGMLASNLYLRSQRRADALFTALSCRGYAGELRVLVDPAPWSSARVAAIMGLVGALAAFGMVVPT